MIRLLLLYILLQSYGLCCSYVINAAASFSSSDYVFLAKVESVVDLPSVKRPKISRDVYTLSVSLVSKGYLYKKTKIYGPFFEPCAGRIRLEVGKEYLFFANHDQADKWLEEKDSGVKDLPESDDFIISYLQPATIHYVTQEKFLENLLSEVKMRPVRTDSELEKK